MRSRILLSALVLSSPLAWGQTPIAKYVPGTQADGAVYYLPKTQLRIAVQVEKTSYTPGEFCAYAQKYLKLDKVVASPTVAYRLISINIKAEGVADTSKCYRLKFNGKGAASNLQLAEDGTLLAVNAQVEPEPAAVPFAPAKKEPRVNPRSLLTQEIVESGSTAKMAELVAQEIYAIRDSRTMLSRGEAEFMPKDGEQLRLMLEQLKMTEDAYMCMFAGVTEKDTAEYVFTYCPQRGKENDILFRLSNRLGMVDKDDLSGKPYYISITDYHTVPAPVEDPKAKKKLSFDGLFVNVPGKIKASIVKDTKPIGSMEFYAGQYGNVELLDGDLFNRKFTTHLTLNPLNGKIDKLEAEQPKQK